MRIETVTIHQVIDGRPVESQVPEENAASWVAQGWAMGPFPTGDNRPPKAGKGSGLDAWLTYATQRDLPVDGMSRDEIIAQVEMLDRATPAAGPGDEPAPVGANPDPEEGDQS